MCEKKKSAENIRIMHFAEAVGSEKWECHWGSIIATIATRNSKTLQLLENAIFKGFNTFEPKLVGTIPSKFKVSLFFLLSQPNTKLRLS